MCQLRDAVVCLPKQQRVKNKGSDVRVSSAESHEQDKTNACSNNNMMERKKELIASVQPIER